VAREAALSAEVGAAEGYVGWMLWVWGYLWVEYRSVCWEMEVGAQMLLMDVQTLALRCLCARTQIRREQAEAIRPSQDLKQVAMGLAWQTPVDVRSLQSSALASCLLTWVNHRWQGKGQT